MFRDKKMGKIRWLVVAEALVIVVIAVLIVHNYGSSARLMNKYNKHPNFEAVESTLLSDLERVKENPEDDGSYYSLGQGFYGLQGYDDAIWAFKEAIRIAPDKHYYWSFLGKAYQGLAKNKNDKAEALEPYRMARDAYIKALELEPDTPNNYTTLAWLYYFRLEDEVSKAYDVLKKGLEEFPDDKDVLFDITRYYMYDNNREEFLKYAPRYLKIDPENEPIKKRYKEWRS